jgi:hypothetical protein
MDRIAAACLALAPLALAMGVRAQAAGSFPPGLWKLNEVESRTLAPKSQLLWIERDDGRLLSFEIRETRADGTHTTLKWGGAYDGRPRMITGAPGSLAVAHGPNGSILISGLLPAGVRLKEVCHVLQRKQRLTCSGTQWRAGAKPAHYLEIYDRQQ